MVSLMPNTSVAIKLQPAERTPQLYDSQVIKLGVTLKQWSARPA
ncbi:MAG: hypothetical protein ACREYE_12180 [Gammaproteobacteria bacterium]